MLPLWNISYLSPMCYKFWEKCPNSHNSGLGRSTPLKGSLSGSTGTVVIDISVLLPWIQTENKNLKLFSIRGFTLRSIFLRNDLWVMLLDFTEKNAKLGREICIKLKIDLVENNYNAWQTITIICVTLYVCKRIFRLEL